MATRDVASTIGFYAVRRPQTSAVRENECFRALVSKISDMMINAPACVRACRPALTSAGSPTTVQLGIRLIWAFLEEER